MSDFSYPFDAETILKKKKSYKRKLLERNIPLLGKNIAILGGSTTTEITQVLELFLLNHGIEPVFYESGFAQYWQDAMYSEELRSFTPNIIFIHTTVRNINVWPSLRDNRENIDSMLNEQISHFTVMWDKLARDYSCPIIQNNFERPLFRLFGNKDISDFHGRSNYVSRLNQAFYEYSQENSDFYINDIEFLSSFYGLDKWNDTSHWYLYKYALSVSAIPQLAFSVANIIKSIYGMNKKAIVLDLDDTLWGGVIGDDGIDGISIGPETPNGQVYSDFQEYIKMYKDLGILLNICSKNDHANAISGLNHPDSLLSPDDFTVIKANWNRKDENIQCIAEELNIGADSLLFIDDNPAERAFVAEQIKGIAVPDFDDINSYIPVIDHSGFFEVTNISEDDLNRHDMYRLNAKRNDFQKTFQNYSDYLKSLEMVATIRDFEPIYYQRIAQLINRSNQFNLTTKRYTENEIATIARDDNYISLYGKLTDRFGDNGLVSVIIGRTANVNLHIELWLMSCRVIKRDMELAMLDILVESTVSAGIEKIIGYYHPTKKNTMVRDFYNELGFDLLSNNDGHTVWEYKVSGHKKRNFAISVSES